ncbi:MAG: TatD family hydrolase [Candidatus Woesearchaeota archaeon]
MKLTDVHAHLDICQDVEGIITRAKEAGVGLIISNATDLESMKQVLFLEKTYDICKSALGIYPDTVVDSSAEQLTQMLDFVREHAKTILAVGEIGLDYKWTKDSQGREKQKIYFQKQLELAKDIEKPTIIHSRNAEQDVIDMVHAHAKTPAILHCFCGKQTLVKEALKNPLIFFSIPSKAYTDQQFQQLIQLVPVSRMFLETDSPYLHFEKGKKNEPATIAFTVKTIAKIKQLDEGEVANMLAQNFHRVFL